MSECLHFNAETRRGGDRAVKAREILHPISALPHDTRVLTSGCLHFNTEARRGGDSAEKAKAEFFGQFPALPRLSGNFSPVTPFGRSITDSPLARRTWRLPLNLKINSARSPKLRASASKNPASPVETPPPTGGFPRLSRNFSPVTPFGRSLTDSPLARCKWRLPLNLKIDSARSPKVRASALKNTASPAETPPPTGGS